MKQNSSAIEYITMFSPYRRDKIRQEGRVSICDLFAGFIHTTLVLLLALIFGTIVLFYPVGNVIGELAAAIFTGYWFWNSAYGFAVIIIGGVLAAFMIIFVIAGVFEHYSNQENKSGIIYTTFESIRDKACYYIKVD